MPSLSVTVALDSAFAFQLITIAELGSAVPVSVTPAAFSLLLMASSPATVLMIGDVGARVSTVTLMVLAGM